jgi:hypothetical protein
MQPNAQATHALSSARRVELAGRRTLDLPLAIQEQALFGALFPAPIAEAKKLLPSRKLRLVPALPGKTLVGFACRLYKRLDGLPAHMELGVLVPVRLSPRLDVPLLPLFSARVFPDAGYYFHRLVSTSSESCELATQVYGARMSLGEIQLDEQPFWQRCTVRVEGRLLLSLDIRKVPAREGTLETRTYSLLGSELLATQVSLRGELGFRRGPHGTRLSLGDHYIADELRALQLGHTAFATLYAPRASGELSAPYAAFPA